MVESSLGYCAHPGPSVRRALHSKCATSAHPFIFTSHLLTWKHASLCCKLSGSAVILEQIAWPDLIELAYVAQHRRQVA